MPRLICSAEIPSPVRSCVTTMLKIHRHLLGKISPNQLPRVLCTAFFVIYICKIFKTQPQFLTSYLLLTGSHELTIFRMQNGCKLPNKPLINACLSSPLAVHGLHSMASFLSHLNSCACLNCITNNLK